MDGCLRNLQDHRGSGRGDCEQNDGLQSPWAVPRTREPGSCQWCVAEGTVCMSGPFLCCGFSSPGKVKRETLHPAGKRLVPTSLRRTRGQREDAGAPPSITSNSTVAEHEVQSQTARLPSQSLPLADKPFIVFSLLICKGEF